MRTSQFFQRLIRYGKGRWGGCVARYSPTNVCVSKDVSDGVDLSPASIFSTITVNYYFVFGPISPFCIFNTFEPPTLPPSSPFYRFGHSIFGSFIYGRCQRFHVNGSSWRRYLWCGLFAEFQLRNGPIRNKYKTIRSAMCWCCWCFCRFYLSYERVYWTWDKWRTFMPKISIRSFVRLRSYSCSRLSSSRLFYWWTYDCRRLQKTIGCMAMATILNFHFFIFYFRHTICHTMDNIKIVMDDNSIRFYVISCFRWFHHPIGSRVLATAVANNKNPLELPSHGFWLMHPCPFPSSIAHIRIDLGELCATALWFV